MSSRSDNARPPLSKPFSVNDRQHEIGTSTLLNGHPPLVSKQILQFHRRRPALYPWIRRNWCPDLSYLSARALPTPQNHPIVAPAAYAPYLGASTLAPSSATLNTTHVNQTRLLSAQAVLPRRGSRRGGRPLGSTGRQGPSIAPEPALSMQSCTFQDSDGVWKFRITVQVYPPMMEDSKVVPVVFHSLSRDWTNYLETNGLLFTYEFSSTTPVQVFLQHVLTDLRRRNYTLPPVHHFGDTSGAPMSHIQLLALINKGKPNKNQIKLHPVIKPAIWTIENLAADKNCFASPELCIEAVPSRMNRFILRIIPMVYPLYRQEGPISHICLSNETYARFPRDGGSVCSPAGSICECEEGEWSDLVDEETTRNLLINEVSSSSISTSSSSNSNSGPQPLRLLVTTTSNTLQPAGTVAQLPSNALLSALPRLALRSLPVSSPLTPPSAPRPLSSNMLPNAIWNENTVFRPELDVDGIFDIDEFMSSVYSTASMGGIQPPLHIRASDLDAASTQYMKIIDECLEQGDCERLLVKAHQCVFSLQYPHSASGPGVEREVLWNAFCAFDKSALLMPREDGCSTLRPLFTSPDMPANGLRPWMLPYFSFLSTMGTSTPSIRLLWVNGTPRLRHRILDLLDLGPDADLTPFDSDLATYFDTNASVYRGRDLPTRLALAPLLLYTATVGTALPNNPCLKAFWEGFELKCPRTAFSFPEIVRSFQGGSERFLSLSATSFIADPDDLLSSARFLTPTNTVQWTASLRTETGQPSLTLRSLFETFVQGRNIPCPLQFEAARGSFPRIVDLSRIDTLGWRAQMVAWAATGSPFIDVGSDPIEIGPISSTEPMYASEYSELYAGAGTICLARAHYEDTQEPSSFQQAYDFWMLRECLQLARFGTRGFVDGLLNGAVIGVPPILNYCSPKLQARVTPEESNYFHELKRKAQHTLSSQQNTWLKIKSFTRAKFEELHMDLFRQTMKPVEEVVLVDDSTCIPKVQQLLKEYSGEQPSNGINPDEAGTADVVLVDVSPLALSIKHMPSEQGQIGAIRELADVYLKRWPALFTKLPTAPNETVLVILRKVTGLLLRQLGNVPPPVQDNRRAAGYASCTSEATTSTTSTSTTARSWSFMELLQRDLASCSRPPWDPMSPSRAGTCIRPRRAGIHDPRASLYVSYDTSAKGSLLYRADEGKASSTFPDAPAFWRTTCPRTRPSSVFGIAFRLLARGTPPSAPAFSRVLTPQDANHLTYLDYLKFFLVTTPSRWDVKGEEGSGPHLKTTTRTPCTCSARLTNPTVRPRLRPALYLRHLLQLQFVLRLMKREHQSRDHTDGAARSEPLPAVGAGVREKVPDMTTTPLERADEHDVRIAGTEAEVARTCPSASPAATLVLCTVRESALGLFGPNIQCRVPLSGTSTSDTSVFNQCDHCRDAGLAPDKTKYTRIPLSMGILYYDLRAASQLGYRHHRLCSAHPSLAAPAQYVRHHSISSSGNVYDDFVTFLHAVPQAGIQPDIAFLPYHYANLRSPSPTTAKVTLRAIRRQPRRLQGGRGVLGLAQRLRLLALPHTDDHPNSNPFFAMFSLCKGSPTYEQCGKKSGKPSTNEAQVSMIKGYREKIEQELARICKDILEILD
ncbi:hypothetical protein B0H14DRAFT_3736322 [Mycena olivaceomarginata]|nr:hypothetical protein B0H14DRAFT_3736322 [Mycena olivaceomarginata]